MVPHSPKRRKLNHNEGNQRYGRSASSDSDEGNGTQSTAPAGPKGLNANSKRSRESDLNAPYAGGLYKSSMFKLQLDEMLLEVRPNYAKIMEPLDNTLRKLKNLIQNIEAREPLTVSEASKLMHKTHKINIPFPDPSPNMDAAYKLAYLQPSNINVVGSYALKTMAKGDRTLAVDMVVTMPASILQEKDYLNYRYFYKRAFYLACLAAGLQENGGNELELCFDYLGGNSLLPILIAKPSKLSGESASSSSKYHIHIIPAAPDGFFLETKLRPNKNAVRPSVWGGGEGSPLSPTPFYNASLRADCNFNQYLKLLHHSSKHADGFTDACVLGRIWLRQRGFGGAVSSGGFGPFEWAALSALLLQGGGPKGHSILSPTYNSYQLFKAVIQYLCTTDLAKKPILLQASGVVFPNTKFPTFYDGPRGHNILFKMTPWSYALLREEAKISLDMLNDTAFDQFEASFILKKDDPLEQFDSLFQLSASTSPREKLGTDHLSNISIFASDVYAVLKEGLNNRVKLIQLKVPESVPWSLKSTSQSTSDGILVGVIFDPANVDRVVSHGPTAEDKESAAKFRKFWGEKAELRRFKDGSIRESLVWSNVSGDSIFMEIVSYLLKRHFGLEVGENIKFVGDNFSQILPINDSSAKAFGDLKEAFNAFEQDIRGMENLPLHPKQVSAMGSQLRLSSLQLPVFTRRQRLREPAEVLIQFEDSGRWPDNIVAIQRTKMALLLKVGNLLETSVHGLIAKLGLENIQRPLLNCAMLDVLYPSGATFRLRIHIEREQALLDRQIKDKSIDSHAREEAASARSLNIQMFAQLPLHTQSVVASCTQYPLLSPTIRLVKKWFESHMLSGHVREELVELLVMRTFLQPYPWRAPSSSSTGFLRTLQFISRWDWRMTPLIVDFARTMTPKDVVTINTRLEAWRKIDPGMNRIVLFAASSYDMTGTAFTDGGPSKVVAARMTALARSACTVAKDRGLELNPKNLFKSSTNDYDFVVHISPNFAGTQRGNKDPKPPQFKNLEVQSEENLSLVGYEPLQLFLDELKALYTTSIVFFNDTTTRSIIGGLWSPQTTSRPLKTNLPYGTKPVSGGSSGEQEQLDVEIDKAAILSEITRLGGDMVARIEARP